MTPRALSKLLVISTGGIAGLALGCVITTGDGNGNTEECGDLLTHSHVEGDFCYCDQGYEWEDPNDPNNFDCQSYDPKGGGSECTGPNTVLDGDVCFCVSGYAWCSDDPNDYSCCLDGDKEPGGTGDTGVADSAANTGTDSGGVDESGGGMSCEGVAGTDPPESCTPDQEGFAFCSHSVTDGAAGSRYYTCQSGAFVEWTQEMLDADCMSSNFDFSLGCADNPETMQAEILCAVGPGTACENCGVVSCSDGDLIQECIAGKLSQDSCMRICMEDGDEMGIQYDSGECFDPGDGMGASCCCFDDGETPCSQVGGTEGGGSTSAGDTGSSGSGG